MRVQRCLGFSAPLFTQIAVSAFRRVSSLNKTGRSLVFASGRHLGVDKV